MEGIVKIRRMIDYSWVLVEGRTHINILVFEIV